MLIKPGVLYASVMCILTNKPDKVVALCLRKKEIKGRKRGSLQFG